MATDLGATLSDSLFLFLNSDRLSEKINKVILFSTVDPDGWPRHGMLSPAEVVARDRHRLLVLLYKSSRAAENLLKNGKISFILVDPALSFYVRCSGSLLPQLSEAPSENLFDLRVVSVIEDRLSTAHITSGITFEGYDPGMTRENRELVFKKLLLL
ncbi:MAG: pyridoxamine 5'-phosphate oxidase family protein [Acidobacteria bacterium]|nr:pyridoxamine 5'-phosphate oxidase family protein [Acidobacteriota bacterium]